MWHAWVGGQWRGTERRVKASAISVGMDKECFLSFGKGIQRAYRWAGSPFFTAAVDGEQFGNRGGYMAKLIVMEE